MYVPKKMFRSTIYEFIKLYECPLKWNSFSTQATIQKTASIKKQNKIKEQIQS